MQTSALPLGYITIIDYTTGINVTHIVVIDYKAFDEDLLKLEGVTDLERYNCVPGGTPMRIEFLPTI